MANLGTFKINTNGEYQNLATVLDMEFEVGKSYLMQGRTNPNIDPASKEYGFWVRVGELGEGFKIENSNPFQMTFTDTDDTLYIKSYGNVTFNISLNS